MIYDTPSLTRMAVAKAIAHPTDDLPKVSGQVLNMTTRNGFLHPETRPTAGQKTQNFYRPSDAVIAAVVLRLWNAGFTNSDTFNAAVSRLTLWRLTDRPEFVDWKPGDPEPPDDLPDPPGRPESPAGFVLKDFCEDGGLWTLRIDVRRHGVTGRFRHVAGLMRGDGDWLGNGITEHEGEEPQSSHVIVLDGILKQIASHTIFKGGRNGTH